jgi:hypothetical protein
MNPQSGSKFKKDILIMRRGNPKTTTAKIIRENIYLVNNLTISGYQNNYFVNIFKNFWGLEIVLSEYS